MKKFFMTFIQQVDLIKIIDRFCILIALAIILIYKFFSNNPSQFKNLLDTIAKIKGNKGSKK